MAADLPLIPPRPADGHKGTFGTVCVVGGRADEQRVMVGGPALAALGALRAGCGLAVLAVPTPVMAAALVIAPVATGIALPVDDAGALRPSDAAQLLDRHMNQFQAVVIGPGLGTGVPQQQIVVRLIGNEDVPMVIDADALNCLAALPDFTRDFRASAVLTPHPGEFARLAAALQIDQDPVNPATREAAARQLAQRVGCVVVLKGRHTVISDGVEAFTNTSGNVALATGGTGDVLAGIIASLIAQFGSHRSGRKPPLRLIECARLGVYLHGVAADRWASLHGDAGMLATDLLGEIPGAIQEMRKRN